MINGKNILRSNDRTAKARVEIDFDTLHEAELAFTLLNAQSAIKKEALPPSSFIRLDFLLLYEDGAEVLLRSDRGCVDFITVLNNAGSRDTSKQHKTHDRSGFTFEAKPDPLAKRLTEKRPPLSYLHLDERDGTKPNRLSATVKFATNITTNIHGSSFIWRLVTPSCLHVSHARSDTTDATHISLSLTHIL